MRRCAVIGLLAGTALAGGIALSLPTAAAAAPPPPSCPTVWLLGIHGMQEGPDPTANLPNSPTINDTFNYILAHVPARKTAKAYWISYHGFSIPDVGLSFVAGWNYMSPSLNHAVDAIDTTWYALKKNSPRSLVSNGCGRRDLDGGSGDLTV